MLKLNLLSRLIVHGDIRHLEIICNTRFRSHIVHGDIRHLEMVEVTFILIQQVHGDIRHLEKFRHQYKARH